jgi:hypothetical protein
MSGPDDTQVEGMYFSVMRMNMIHNVHYVLLVSLQKENKIMSDIT